MSNALKKRWTPAEDEIIKQRYPKEGPRPLLITLPHRTLQAIKARAYQFDLRFIEAWTEEEYHVLREYFPSRGQGFVAAKLDRSRACVKAMAQHLGIKGRPNWRTETQAGNGSYRGRESLSGTKWCEIRDGAVRRNIDFDITIDHAWEIYERQHGLCALSGVPIWFPSNRATRDGNASLDRIDSSEGYVKGNVQWVHVDVNHMKWDLAQSDFVDYCHKVAALHPKSS